ncbi:MAG TPA: DUF1223 domain-containing protein [Phycisphaerae bacterium]|nr:DUF1223 domain-containing protein [Phycisphaerae bacterium]
MKTLFLTGLLAGLAAISHGAPLSFSSGNGHVTLIELYTSEGCNSCPPADKWLTSLRDAPGLWKDFVPVGFHVDYWNGLGWADRYAMKAFTERQHALVAEWDIPSAYTPCFARDGREWRGKRELKGGPMPGGGRLSLEIGDAGKIQIEFKPDKPSGAAGYTVHVALLGNGFTSRVTAGENRGETLRHDFVALDLVEAGLRPGNGAFTAELSLPTSAIKPVPRKAVAAWVTRRGSFVSLQAAGGWLE